MTTRSSGSVYGIKEAVIRRLWYENLRGEQLKVVVAFAGDVIVSLPNSGKKLLLLLRQSSVFNSRQD